MAGTEGESKADILVVKSDWQIRETSMLPMPAVNPSDRGEQMRTQQGIGSSR